MGDSLGPHFTPSPELGLGGAGNSVFTGAEGLAMRAGALSAARMMVEVGDKVLEGIGVFTKLFDVTNSTPFNALAKKAMVIIELAADLALASQTPSVIPEPRDTTPIDGENLPK